ncbi:MAG: glycosyltransferase [Desulfovibrio sp.]|nr:glycosyltransferase [Desulfovibrio sp.]
MKKTIIVMPVANEEQTIGQTIDEILKLNYEDLYLYPIIDSFSKDRTESIIRSYEEVTDKVRCVFFKESRGVVSCYLEGFRQALKDGAEFILEMDGGGSHKPGEIPQFLQNLEKGYDCVWGSRFIEGGGIENHPLYRRILSYGGTWLANAVLGTALKDMTSGFEAFNVRVLERMDFDRFLSTGHMYQTEMRYYCKDCSSVEVPITYTGSNSSLRFSEVKKALKILFALKANKAKIWK